MLRYNIKSTRQRAVCVQALLSPQRQQCLAYSRCLVSICRINEWRKEPSHTYEHPPGAEQPTARAKGEPLPMGTRCALKTTVLENCC